VQLGEEVLANALLELAARSSEADDMVARLIAKPQENIGRYQDKLRALRQMRRFVEWQESDSFAHELASILSDLKAGVTDPRTGVEQVVAFFELDEVIMENCDDSDGVIGDVFTSQARDLFWFYAGQCEDRDWVFDLAVTLSANDNYGVRDTLLDVPEDLPDATVRYFIERLWQLADNTSDSSSGRRWIRDVQVMARRLKDPDLFEKCAWMLEKDLSGPAMFEIAKVYLESGDAESALYWIERIPPKGAHGIVWGYDDLLFQIHKQLNNTKEMANIAWKQFHAYRSERSFEALISAIGEEQRKKVIDDEARLIHQSEVFSPTDLAFLLHVERVQDAEDYVLRRVGQLDGSYYGSLVPIAEALESEGRFLASTLIYRSLLDSILQRAQSRAYHHGADYLKKLELMAPKISRWEGHMHHGHYVNGLRVSHGRKYGFWGQFRQ